jgi:glycerophosphoryl diester phosphodiesterase
MKLIYTLLIFAFSMSALGQAKPWYIAHRGASHDAPENTVASAKLAWEQGADAVEIDVYLASDNRIVVIHDKNTKRVSGGKNMTIADSPSLILREMEVGSWKGEQFKGEKIPFIEEIIETVPEGKTLVVEVKCGPEIIPHMERVLSKKKCKGEILFIAFGWETITGLKQAFPDSKAYWLSSAKPDVKKRLPEVKSLGLEGVNLQYGIIDQEVVTEAHNLGLEVLAWTVDDPTEARRLIDLGVTKITTNRPGWLREQIEK